MRARHHDSVDDFRATAEPLYRSDPVAHTVELTLLQSNRVPADAVLLTLWDDATLVGAAMQTPPMPLLANAIPPGAAATVAEEVSRLRPGLPGVRGVRPATIAFADAWRTVTGRRGVVTVEERLHRLGHLRPPNGVAGRARLATTEDTALLVDWIEAFYGETFGHPRDDAAGRRLVATAFEVGDRILLWTVDAEPVGMAMLRAPAAGVARIGPVFTPADRRGRGYGSAVTAAAAAAALADGVTGVVLFTDLANPVSNAIYRRIGFEPVADCVHIDFSAG
ncbi:GNAT family N-acetyltransferase [Mycobacterium manitobense]|uniref:GNAT family N-acetyltransferase n=1 Tax=[Mycobacterium] manitobense TaxID=190147 RepID=A0A9X3BTR0_9MYCO|nr:GNAT family N-acetyltransferase [[Mycobacterium] manitobense]MCV7168646.1 GNAT family N-acetyltransferase [[Mycobacterium] manitobense]